MQNKKHETAVEMLKSLLNAGGTPADMIETMAHLSGMVAAGLSFSVAGKGDSRKKAYSIQTDIAKATRLSIDCQPDEAFSVLSFKGMFNDIDSSDKKAH